MIKSVHGHQPILEPHTYLAETAAVIGSVTVRSGASIWYGAVLRGDSGAITIGERTNIQDNVTIHEETSVGHDVTVGHNAVLHGCRVEPHCLIGMNCTILDGTVIGEGSIVAAGCLIPKGQIIPAGSIVMGVPGKITGRTPDNFIELMKLSASHYIELAEEQF